MVLILTKMKTLLLHLIIY